MLYTKPRNVCPDLCEPDGFARQLVYSLFCVGLFIAFVASSYMFFYRPVYLAGVVLFGIFMCAGYDYAKTILQALHRKRVS